MRLQKKNKLIPLYKQFNRLKVHTQNYKKKQIIQRTKIVSTRKLNYFYSYKNSKYKNVFLAYQKIKLFIRKFAKKEVKKTFRELIKNRKLKKIRETTIKFYKSKLNSILHRAKYISNVRTTRIRKKRKERISTTAALIKKRSICKNNKLHKLKIVLVVDNNIPCILHPKTQIALIEKMQAITSNPMVQVTTHPTMSMNYFPIGSFICSGRFEYIIAEVSTTPDYNINDVYNIIATETLLYDCQDLLNLNNIKSYILNNPSPNIDFDVDSDSNDTGESDDIELPTDEFLNSDSDSNNKNFNFIRNFLQFCANYLFYWLILQLYNIIYKIIYYKMHQLIILIMLFLEQFF